MTLLWLAAALAGQPLWRSITADDGLLSEHVDDLALGPDGVLWIATHAGLYRWDGRRASRVDGGLIDHEIIRLVVDRQGVAVARDALGGGWRLEDGEVARLMEGDRPAVLLDLTLDPAGEVRLLVPAGLARLRGGQVEPRGPRLPEGARVLRPGPDDTWVVGTRDAFWRVPEVGAASRLVDATIAVDAEVAPDGSVWTLDLQARVRRVDTRGTILVQTEVAARGMSLALRGDEAWVAIDGGLLRVQPDGRQEHWSAAQGVNTGGPLLIDREGSVWLGTFRGLQQLPEPGAQLWSRLDGLPLDTARDVELAPGRVWVSTWGGLGWVDLRSGSGHSFAGPVIKNQVCLDGAGVAWTIGTDGHDGPPQIVALDPDGATRTWPAPTRSHFGDGCVRSADGRVWLTAEAGLLRTEAAGPPALVTAWPEGRPLQAVRRVIEARDGAVWVGGGGQVCGWRAPGPWRCADLPGRAWVVDLVETEAGHIWACDIDNGVTRLDGDRLVPIPGAAALPSRHVLGLEPAAAGGTWVLGHGVVARVTDRPELADGWVVEEELQAWLGHLVSGAVDLAEAPDGQLWIAHNGGLTSVSAESRSRPADAPGVLVEELRLDGTVVREREVHLPSPGSHVSLRYVAASWRAPSLLRYRVRVDGGAWEATAEPGWMELRGLAPGVHAVELAASTDGQRWTEPPTRVTLHVPRPWYGRPEPWVGLGALLLVGLLVAERLRSTLELRVAGLRTRIALDLHDHMGSGLGAISLLAGVVGQQALPEAARAEAARRIGDTASELGAALRGIVWSLRPDSLYTDELGRWIAERGRALLGGVELTLEVSEVREPMDLDVLRAVQLIALEALHNAARHAAARRVRLGFGPTSAGWTLLVQDDGRGLGAAEPRLEGGNGLEGMRQRAAEIGGELLLEGSPGTRVELRFQPRRSRWRRA